SCVDARDLRVLLLQHLDVHEHVLLSRRFRRHRRVNVDGRSPRLTGGSSNSSLATQRSACEHAAVRVFVTGATGFIGRHLCRRLTARGDRVTALVRTAAKASLLGAGVDTLPGDLSLFADRETALPPFDVVIHLAGVVTAEKLGDYERV